jgi:hypothetical protein
MLEAKTSKLKSLRKESDKAKIILLPFFHLVRDLIPLCTEEKRECVGGGSCCDRRPVQHSIAPNIAPNRLGIYAPPKPRENDESSMKVSQARE